MEVAGSGINNGDNIRQNTYNGGLNQQWDIGPIPYDNGGGNSYYRLTAAHSGKAADGFNFSLEKCGFASGLLPVLETTTFTSTKFGFRENSRLSSPPTGVVPKRGTAPNFGWRLESGIA